MMKFEVEKHPAREPSHIWRRGTGIDSLGKEFTRPPQRGISSEPGSEERSSLGETLFFIFSHPPSPSLLRFFGLRLSPSSRRCADFERLRGLPMSVAPSRST